MPQSYNDYFREDYYKDPTPYLKEENYSSPSATGMLGAEASIIEIEYPIGRKRLSIWKQIWKRIVLKLKWTSLKIILVVFNLRKRKRK